MELISKQAAIEALKEPCEQIKWERDTALAQLKELGYGLGEKINKGEISDGYHTFNQLYHQRAVLFATIVNQNKSRSWKSYKHSDGQYCFDSNGEWFIVGVDTPKGNYTYHYSKEYWNMFDCKELERGKEWDGHTEEDVTRLLSLQQEPCEDAVSREDALTALTGDITGYIIEDYIARTRIRLQNLPPVTPKPGLCKDCKFFETDSWAKVNGIPLIVAHEICNRWGDGCKTSEDGYCFLFEPKEGESE